jgi:anaerobic ribonucleoside-triphosphate reductase activating protein
MNYSKIDHMSIVDGEGNRVSLFVSGCRNHCPGCFNEATWDFDYGQPFTPIEENEVIEACRPNYIAGLTVLGGEPMEPENQEALLPFLRRFKEACPDKTIWLFTGYVLDRDLLTNQRKNVPGVTNEILSLLDMLVDGPFIMSQRDLTLKFRGSRNQRLIPAEDIRKYLSST